nr:MAG TPA: hypothetical protein [Caudoviricetes sp.]
MNYIGISPRRALTGSTATRPRCATQDSAPPRCAQGDAPVYALHVGV